VEWCGLGVSMKPSENPALATALADASSLIEEIAHTTTSLATPRSLGQMLADLDHLSKRAHELGDAYLRIKEEFLKTPFGS
jgi:hypothetical protein